MAAQAWTRTLLEGLAGLLDQAGVSYWLPDGVAEDSDGPIEPATFLIDLPATPDRVVCLTDYPVADDPGMADAIIGVQVRVRGGRDPLEASDTRDGVYSVFHGLRAVTFTPPPGDDGELVVIAQMYRQNATPIGPDGQGRNERVENYYVHVNRAGADLD